MSRRSLCGESLRTVHVVLSSLLAFGTGCENLEPPGDSSDPAPTPQVASPTPGIPADPTMLPPGAAPPSAVPGAPSQPEAPEPKSPAIEKAEALKALGVRPPIGPGPTTESVQHLNFGDIFQPYSPLNQQITDADLELVREFPNLTGAALSNFAKITDAALIPIASVPKLERLRIHHCPITDAGLAHLSNVATLKVLELTGTQISDAGLVHLQKLESLEDLWVGNTRITEAGLAHIAELKNLTRVLLPRTIPQAAVARLKQSRPELNVDYHD